MTITTEMPKYVCHKEVWALKIKSISEDQVGDNKDRFALLDFAEAGYAPKPVSTEWYFKHKPEAGGYYVVYADGYASYSPAKAFEDGYTRIEPASAPKVDVWNERY